MSRLLAMTKRGAAAAAVTMLLLAFAAAGCQRVAPVRTLPPWVQGVYIPMLVNKSYEPALEEDATRFTQEAFLLDGRLNVVPERTADLILRAEITDWRTRVGGKSGDDIVDQTEYWLSANVHLFEPLATEPLAELPPVVIRREFIADARSIDYVPEVDRKRELLRTLGEAIMQQTINGFPTNVATVPGVPAAAPQLPSQIESFDLFDDRPGTDR